MKESARAVAKPKTPAEISGGIKFDVRGSALIAQAKERIAWHKQNAATMAAELRTLSPNINDPRQHFRHTDITRLMRGHEEYARFLTFVARNLMSTRTYRVSLQDLSHLEIMPKGLYL